MTKTSSLLALCLVLAVASAIITLPELPQQWSATVSTTMPMIGEIQGTMYYDFLLMSGRMDASQFGMTMIDLYKYDRTPPMEYQIAMGQCQAQVAENPFTPMILPPWATPVGTDFVNGQSCTVWKADMPMMPLSFYVYNTTSNNRTSFFLARMLVSTPMGDVQTDWLKYLTVGPQDPDLFNEIKLGCPAPPPPPSFTAEGYVTDAVTGAGVTGAKVSYTSPGLGTLAATTDSNGKYSISGFKPGLWVAFASKPGYITGGTSLMIDHNYAAGGAADIVISPMLMPGQYRAVLTWGAAPSDLDLHVKFPNGCDVNFASRLCIDFGVTASLDRDSQQGFGPETITMVNAGVWAAGVFDFYVYIYAGGTSYSGSNAVVNFYSSSGPSQKITLPSVIPNNALYWHVFTLDHGNFTLVNKIGGMAF